VTRAQRRASSKSAHRLQRVVPCVMNPSLPRRWDSWESSFGRQVLRFHPEMKCQEGTVEACRTGRGNNRSSLTWRRPCNRCERGLRGSVLMCSHVLLTGALRGSPPRSVPAITFIPDRGQTGSGVHPNPLMPSCGRSTCTLAVAVDGLRTCCCLDFHLSTTSHLRILEVGRSKSSG
jgi:hypothetical protein